MTAHICSFGSLPDNICRQGYDALKAAALEAGRFSAFEVPLTSAAGLFTRLCRDPDIETFDLGYPWTGVCRRETKP